MRRGQGSCSHTPSSPSSAFVAHGAAQGRRQGEDGSLLCPAQTLPALPLQGSALLTLLELFEAETGREMSGTEPPRSAHPTPAGPGKGSRWCRAERFTLAKSLFPKLLPGHSKGCHCSAERFPSFTPQMPSAGPSPPAEPKARSFFPRKSCCSLRPRRAERWVDSTIW